MHCEHCESAVIKRAENPQQELRSNAIEHHASSVGMPWSPLGHCDGPFSTKNIRVFLQRSVKLNNSVPTVEKWLGVTGL